MRVIGQRRLDYVYVWVHVVVLSYEQRSTQTRRDASTSNRVSRLIYLPFNSRLIASVAWALPFLSIAKTQLLSLSRFVYLSSLNRFRLFRQTQTSCGSGSKLSPINLPRFSLLFNLKSMPLLRIELKRDWWWFSCQHCCKYFSWNDRTCSNNTVIHVSRFKRFHNKDGKTLASLFCFSTACLFVNPDY